MLHQLVRFALLLTVLLRRARFEDAGIVFGDPDVSATFSTRQGEFHLDAFKAAGNDRILQSRGKANGSQLQWFSLGEPRLVRRLHPRNASRELIVDLKFDRVSVMISTFTPAHRKALAAAAQDKYRVDVSERQFKQMPLSSVECEIKMTNDAGQQLLLTGDAINLQQFPLRVDFPAPQSCPARQLLQRLLKSDPDGLKVDCAFYSKGKEFKTKTLELPVELIDRLAIVTKLFGPADAVYVTYEQLVRLSYEMYSALSILEEYAMPQHQFAEAFVSQLLQQTMNSSFSYVDVDRAVGILSSYTLGVEDTSENIRRALSSIFSVKAVGNRKTIVLNQSELQSLSQRQATSASSPNVVTLFGIRVGPSSMLSASQIVSPSKPLEAQLTELNLSPESDVRWSRDDSRLVPSSIQVARIARVSFKKTLRFSRVFSETTVAPFRRVVRMEVAETVLLTPDDSATLLKQQRDISKLALAVEHLRQQQNPEEYDKLKSDVVRLTTQQVMAEVESLVSETTAHQHQLQEQHEELEKRRQKQQQQLDKLESLVSAQQLQLQTLRKRQQEQLQELDQTIAKLESRAEEQQQQLQGLQSQLRVSQVEIPSEGESRKAVVYKEQRRRPEQPREEALRPKMLTEEEKHLIQQWEGSKFDKYSYLNKWRKGSTVLHFASEEGQIEVVRALLARGDNANAARDDGRTPLHLASDCGHAEIVEVLIKAGADVNAATDKEYGPFPAGSTPLHMASFNGSTDVAKLLIENGADVNQKNNDGWTPLHYASKNGHINLVVLLIQNGADVNQQDNNGWTPLHQASYNGYQTIVKRLIKAGASVSEKNNEGETPLHKASYMGHTEAVEALIKSGADVNAKRNDGETALHVASFRGYAETVEVLIKARADINAKRNDGETPLHVASYKGQTEVVRVLLRNNANRNIKDKKGKTPKNVAGADWKADKSQSDVIRQLLNE